MSDLNQNPDPQTQPALCDSTDQPAALVTTPEQAIEKCMTAYERAQGAAAAQGKDRGECRIAGGHAFRLAMPSTATPEGARAFIDCVIRGIHLMVWRGREPMQMFYAAQVAISAHKREPRKK